VIFPETLFASVSHDFSDATEVSASVRWTKWSSLPELRIQTAGLPDNVADYQWEDVTMLSIGVRHHLTDRWTLRAGYARDESPIPGDANRTPRVPDSDRDWFTVGLSARVGERSRIDFAYARVSGEAAGIVNSVNLVASQPGAFTDTLRGDYNNPSVDIFGIQFYSEF
jgi:long-chain fatty acid transport protein